MTAPSLLGIDVKLWLWLLIVAAPTIPIGLIYGAVWANMYAPVAVVIILSGPYIEQKLSGRDSVV